MTVLTWAILGWVTDQYWAGVLDWASGEYGAVLDSTGLLGRTGTGILASIELLDSTELLAVLYWTIDQYWATGSTV